MGKKKTAPSWIPKDLPRNPYKHLYWVIVAKYPNRIPYATPKSSKQIKKAVSSILRKQWEKHHSDNKKPPSDIERLARVGRLGLKDLKRDARIFGTLFMRLTSSKKPPTLYWTTKKRLGRPLIVQNKLDDKERHRTHRGVSNFFNALIDESINDRTLNPANGSGGQFLSLLPKSVFYMALKGLDVRLKMAKAKPSEYRKRHFHQPAPRSVFDEYVNMICRRFFFDLKKQQEKEKDEIYMQVLDSLQLASASELLVSALKNLPIS